MKFKNIIKQHAICNTCEHYTELLRADDVVAMTCLLLYSKGEKDCTISITDGITATERKNEISMGIKRPLPFRLSDVFETPEACPFILEHVV